MGKPLAVRNENFADDSSKTNSVQQCQSAIFTPISVHATNPEKIPENIGRKPGALRNAFPGPIKFTGNCPVN